MLCGMVVGESVSGVPARQRFPSFFRLLPDRSLTFSVQPKAVRSELIMAIIPGLSPGNQGTHHATCQIPGTPMNYI